MRRPFGGAAIARFVSPASVASAIANGPPLFSAWSYAAIRSTRSALPRRNIQKPAAATRTITTAVRTARFVFIQSPSLPSFLDRGACFPLGLAALDGLALVVRLLAFREAD